VSMSVGARSLVVATYIAAALFCCSASRRAFACYQVAPEPIFIDADSLNGRAVREGKPIEGVRFKLHRAITFTRGAGKMWESPAIKTTITTSEGLFTFGEVAPGRYWVVSSYAHSTFPVEIRSPGADRKYKRLFYNNFADGCETLSVENAR